MRLRDQAYATITGRMLDGRLRPGQFVTQRELVAMTGLPLGAVREAIPRLEADGVLQALAQRGLQVTPADPALLRHAYQLREILEVAAVGQFTRAAPDATLAALRAAHARLLNAPGNTPDWLHAVRDADWALHEAMVAALSNPLATEAHRLLLLRIRLMAPASGDPAPALDEHGAILSALKRRDAGDAADALRDHLRQARQRALGLEPERPRKKRK